VLFLLQGKSKAAAAAAPKAAAVPKKAAAGTSKAKPLAPSSAHNVQAVQAAQPAKGAGKAIEEIYQKKSQLEHILLRPDTYIGSTEKQQQPLWVHDGERLVFRAVTYAPGLYKIFDEILVNAADNRVRDPSMDTIRVDICPVGETLRREGRRTGGCPRAGQGEGGQHTAQEGRRVSGQPSAWAKPQHAR
jgi:DNA topoisomerase-2